MKYRWSDLFGSGSVEMPDKLTWKTTLPASTVSCQLFTRFVTDEYPYIQIVAQSQHGENVINLHTEAAVDKLIGELIKMRDIMESSR